MISLTMLRLPAVFLLGAIASVADAQSRPAATRLPARFVNAASASRAGSFPLATAGTAVPLYVEAGDHAGVRRAVANLRQDLGRVTGQEPTLATTAIPNTSALVIVGTLGKSALVDRLVRERKLDVTAIAGKWESSITQVVRNPAPGVAQGLVIAGSDKRGTVFGVYELSSQIGVSPWHWWADVPVPRQRELVVSAGPHVLGEPAVKYRGIFINDEAPAFSGWTREKFGGFNHQVYEHVFELVLRLKGNFLWPAMWGNAFADDDSLNARLASEYGIVMSTSHHEPMTRAQAEWRKYGSGAWNYEQNDSTLRHFWRGGVERMARGGHEHIVTLGMRGDGDMPMTQGSNIALLERIVADQRKIIAEVTRKEPAETPQVWALYKEVQDYYDKGMKVPEDVTLLFADDNWGNVRRLPNQTLRNRRGGYGVYYHFDYVGGPRNYKWINTNPIARVWEQMDLSYRMGADRIWVVNVGDIKPMEYPIEFFLDLAWSPDAWPAQRLPEYARVWAAEQFGRHPERSEGSAVATDEIADIITTYLKYAGRRKPELLAPETYSLANYREAETVVADYAALAARAQRISASLRAEYRDAFYQLVLHPVLAATNLNTLYVTVAKNRLAAVQGRATTNQLADQARALFAKDAEISRYFNDTLASGKWSHMMDQTHIGYTYWQEPPRNLMPRVDVIQVPVAGELGISWEGQLPFTPPGSGFVPSGVPSLGAAVGAGGGVSGAGGGGGPPSGGFRGGPREPTLPTFDPLNRQTYWIDLFNRGVTPVEFSVESGQPWLTVSASSGAVASEQRISVSVDWARAPEGSHRVPITISSTGANARRFMLQAPVRNSPIPGTFAGFVQGDGHVSMEADHYTRAVGSPGVSWVTIPDLGRTRAGVTLTPPAAPKQSLDRNGSWLEYRMFLLDSGAVQVKAYLSPSLDFRGTPDVGGGGLRYAVSLDDESPQVVNMAADSSDAVWSRAVADNIRIMTTRHVVAKPGEHVLKFWAVDAGVVLQKIVVDLGGERPSYLGPPESYYRAAPTATTSGGTSRDRSKRDR